MTDITKDIIIPEQKYFLVRKDDTTEFVIKDGDGDEVTGVFDLDDTDADTAAEGLVDKLLSDVVPDAIGIAVGDLQGEVVQFMEENK